MGTFRLLLHSSLLLDRSGDGGLELRQPVEELLRRLRYSNLRSAVGLPNNLPAEEVEFLKERACAHSLECIFLDALVGYAPADELVVEWRSSQDTCFFVTCKANEDLFALFHNLNWRLICVDSANDSNMDMVVTYVSKVEELLLTICKLIKKELFDSQILMVGYVMKPSREEDFAKRGAFPLCPAMSGLVFVPLSFDPLLDSQLKEVDIILHKVTDEIININLHEASDSREGIILSARMSKIVRFLKDQPDVPVIDPFENIYPLLDRSQIQQILSGLEEIQSENCKLRAPHYLKVDHFHDQDLMMQLTGADLSFPLIVKPQVACGVSDAHNMALIFQSSDFKSLNVPLPAMLQEFVDHGSKIYKFYVLGDEVFYAVRKSIPNASFLQLSSESSGRGPITFNSLKGLPVATTNEEPKDYSHLLNVISVKGAAKWLQRRLGLTIFGFDVVIQEGTGDHVIVDLNYLPSFKEVPNEVAIPAFWNAIKSAYNRIKIKE